MKAQLKKVVATNAKLKAELAGLKKQVGQVATTKKAKHVPA